MASGCKEEEYLLKRIEYLPEAQFAGVMVMCGDAPARAAAPAATRYYTFASPTHTIGFNNEQLTIIVLV